MPYRRYNRVRRRVWAAEQEPPLIPFEEIAEILGLKDVATINKLLREAGATLAPQVKFPNVKFYFRADVVVIARQRAQKSHTRPM